MHTVLVEKLTQKRGYKLVFREMVIFEDVNWIELTEEWFF
jgi:hypothetical protein